MDTLYKSLIILVLLTMVSRHALHSAEVPKHLLNFGAQDIEKILRKGSFEDRRYVTEEGRVRMKKFLRTSLQEIAANQNETITVEEKEYYAAIPSVSLQTRGVNYILRFKGSNPTNVSHPLLFQANYDTPLYGNAVDDNGSGVVALLLLSNLLAQQLKNDQIKINHDVIFAFTDTSFYKYEENDFATPSGAELIAQQYLPSYLADTGSFRGVFLLDKILNYDSETGSQNFVDFKPTFPKAAEEIEARNATGDFLASFYFDQGDSELMSILRSAWSDTMASTKGLIEFPIPSSPSNSLGLYYILEESGLRFFGNNQDRNKNKNFPAVLLTNTGKFRKASCSPLTADCFRETPEDLDFMTRTIKALYATILSVQTENIGNSAPTTLSSTYFTWIASTLLTRLAINQLAS